MSAINSCFVNGDLMTDKYGTKINIYFPSLEIDFCTV